MTLTGGALRADTVIPPITLHNQAGTALPALGSFTSLGCVTMGAATSSVNLSATGGIHFSITGNAQALAQWATGTGPWGNAINLQGTGYLDKQGTLLRFVGNGNGYACISYLTVQASSSGSSGSIQNVSGTVTANQGAAGSTPWGVTVAASPVLNAVSHSTQTYQTYTASVINLSTTAGAAGRYTACFAPSYGGALIRVDFGTSATAPADLYSSGAPIATSANAQCWGPFENGTNAYVIAGGATSVTGKQMIDQVK